MLDIRQSLINKNGYEQKGNNCVMEVKVGFSNIH